MAAGTRWAGLLLLATVGGGDAAGIGRSTSVSRSTRLRQLQDLTKAASAMKSVVGTVQSMVDQKLDHCSGGSPFNPLANGPVTIPPSLRDSVSVDDRIEALTGMIAQLKDTIGEVQKDWYSRTMTCPTLSQKSGLCAVFGDPHFITFDGGHTYFLGERVVWLVKSADVWIQGLAKTVTGNFAGIAVGGPFMQNHTLVLFGTAFRNDGQMRAFYDGNQILAVLDGDGKADFSDEWVKGSRRLQWEAGLHNEAVLNVRPAIEFDVGPWRSRFEGGPSGGLYMFRLARNIQVTATGVDFLSAVIHMPKQKGGQSGYCGDFDGNPDNDFEPLPPGVVPPQIAAAFNRPVGEGLEPVPADMNLFSTVSADDIGGTSLASIMDEWDGLAKKGPAKKAKHKDDPVMQTQETEQTFCSDDRQKLARKACTDIPDQYMKMACVMDVCTTGRASAAASASDELVMESFVHARGVPIFVGHGQCLDTEGRRYRAIRAQKRFSTSQPCQALLRKLADIPGVLGAQRRPTGGCYILVDVGSPAGQGGQPGPGRRPQGKEEPEAWVDLNAERGRADAEGEGGTGRVASASDEVGWNCWLLN